MIEDRIAALRAEARVGDVHRDRRTLVPVHGDCTCPEGDDDLNDRNCNLHSPASSHAAAQ